MAFAIASCGNIDKLGDSQTRRAAMEHVAQAGLLGRNLWSDSLLVAGEAGSANADDHHDCFRDLAGCPPGAGDIESS